jgi:hypothetical protein
LADKEQNSPKDGNKTTPFTVHADDNDSGRFVMSFGRGGKALANERNSPFIVEVPVAANGLDVELNAQIVAFHKLRGIPHRFGRSIWRNEQRYFRWCFSDLETARAFIEQFGGAFYKTSGT